MTYTTFLTVFAFALLPYFCNGQGILEIQIKTASDLGSAGDNIGSAVDISITTTLGLSCEILDLDNGENDFQRGEVNVFFDTALEACLGFVVPDQYIPALNLSHDGRDSWTAEWVRVVLDDSTYLQCNDGQQLNEGESHLLECFPNVGSNVLTEVQIKTANIQGAGTTGTVGVDITTDPATCAITRINNNDRDFQENTVDVFSGSDLEECENFLLVNGVFPTVTLSHVGINNWTPEWVRLVSADSTYLICNVDVELTNNDSTTVACGPFPGAP